MLAKLLQLLYMWVGRTKGNQFQNSIKNVHQLKLSFTNSNAKWRKKQNIKIMYCKGHPPSADLRYGEEDSISPSTLVLAAIKG